MHTPVALTQVTGPARYWSCPPRLGLGLGLRLGLGSLGPHSAKRLLWELLGERACVVCAKSCWAFTAVLVESSTPWGFIFSS